MRSDAARVFLTGWILLAAHFATNVVREHYPAFSLAERGTLRVDPYLGLHSDIFAHSDGHAYIDNQVATSAIAAVPLFVFGPLLDALERYRREEIARNGAAAEGQFRTEYPLRERFYKEVRRRGLDLRFGAAAAITAVLVMAPLSALSAVLILWILQARGVPRGRALALSLVYALGTPVFFRSATLNNNLFVMYSVLGAFALLLVDAARASSRRIFSAGLLAGAAVAFDYSGAVALASFGAWIAFERRSLSACLTFALGALPPLSFLFATQWIQFGNLFLPAQHWMPAAHFTERGWLGFSLPQWDLFLANLFSPDFGLFVYGPILLLALVPSRVDRERRILPRSARRFLLLLSVLFLLFCASNQYARMQWNSGFRHLLPIVPLLYLAACESLARIPRAALFLLAGLAVLHEWVLSMVRFHPQPQDLGDFSRSAVVESWHRFLQGGLQFPWLSVLRQTASADAIVQAWFWPYLVVLLCALLVALVWRKGPAGMATRA
jgi:hypothetical protein